MASIAAFKADLFYGASGTIKTSNIGRVAEWYYKTTGRTSRLVSADGGGWEPLEHLVKAGIIEAWPLRLWEHRVETLDKASQGYWPADILNPRSPLLPPSLIMYTAMCYRCRSTSSNSGEGLLYGPSSVSPSNIVCPKCHAVPGPRDIDVHIVAKHEHNPHNDLRNVALIGIEGLTSTGDAMMEQLTHEKASLSQDPSYSWVDGGTTYSGGNMSYYNFIQQRLYEFVHKSHMIPYVLKVIWTALEARGEEEATRTPIFGPAIVGKKATGKATAWFGNTLHFERVDVVGQADANQQAKVTSSFIMYLRNHADLLTKVPFQAKTRAPYSLAQELPDFMPSEAEKLYQKVEEMKTRAEASVRSLRPPTTQQPATVVTALKQ